MISALVLVGITYKCRLKYKLLDNNKISKKLLRVLFKNGAY